MKSLLIALLCIFLLPSCTMPEKDPNLIKKAYAFETKKEDAVIYVLRDLHTEKLTSIAFKMIQIIDHDDRNKLTDAMNSLDGDSTTGAGISLHYYEFHREGFARFEVAPGKYNLFSFFVFGTIHEIAQSRKEREFKPGKVYFYNITSKPVGPYSSTIYFLNELTKDEAQQIIERKKLQLLLFNPGIDGRKDIEN